MRVIAAAIAGWVAFAAVSVQAAPSPNQKNWLQLGATLFFNLGDQACGYGRTRRPRHPLRSPISEQLASSVPWRLRATPVAPPRLDQGDRIAAVAERRRCGSAVQPA
jgi:hypothetical protein